LLTVFAVAAISAPAPAPQWESDYGKALEQVRSDDRPLLVVLDKPGQEMDAALLGDKEAALLKKYDLCRVDASTKYGKQVADAFKAKTFPHVAFVDKTGAVILHSHQGKIAKTTWESSLAKYQSGEQPQKHIVLRPTTTSNVSGDYYQSQPSSSSYCPSCNKGF
jgi:hypothetical protein